MKNVLADLPAHCQACDKAETCRQAWAMHADTEPVQGMTDFGEAEHFCKHCGTESDDTAPLVETDELDSPAHCSHCGVPLQHALSIHGVACVKESIANGGGCCRELWPVVWADYL